MQHLMDIFDRLAAAIPAFKNLAKACANPAIASWLALPQPEAEVRLLDLFLYHLYPFFDRGLMTRFLASVLLIFVTCFLNFSFDTLGVLFFFQHVVFVLCCRQLFG